MSPAQPLLLSVLRRDEGNLPNDNSDGSWWWSPAAFAVKWGIIGAIFVFFVLFFFGGYWHARRRMSKGLQPLAYHRWLINRNRAQLNMPPQNNVPFYRAQDGYAMHGYAPPPPAYNAEVDHVPAYTPPQGASKVNPSQNYAEMPPPGPPPSQSQGGSSYKPPTVTVTAPEAGPSS